MKHGFSLVELSIVLVILGLLVGGIMTGQNLIHAAELRAVAKEYNQWQTAVNIFQDKYLALPGDMSNATDFWGNASTGTAGGDCLDNDEDMGSGTQTCNGDGDGSIGLFTDIAEDHESIRFWQHLANAGLIPGNYTGVHGPGGDLHVVPGTNAPTSKYGNAGWSVSNYGSYAGDAEMMEYDYDNLLQIGANSGDNMTWHQAFSPEDVWNIDTKVDDGKPGRGRVLIEWWDICSTATSKSDYDGEYLLSDQSELCSIIFPKAF